MKKLILKTNMKPSWNDTNVFLGYDEENFPGTTTFPWKLIKRMYRTTYRFQKEDAADRNSIALSDRGRSTRPFRASKHHRSNKCGYEKALTRSKEEELTKRLSPSSLHHVSFKEETIKGHTPMMLASTRWGIHKSLVKMAFLRARREDIQSRVSALFSQLTINSVMANPSKLLNTVEAVHCKQRLNERRSKLG